MSTARLNPLPCAGFAPWGETQRCECRLSAASADAGGKTPLVALRGFLSS